MATRLYVMPSITETLNGRLTKHPKYDSIWASVAIASQYVDFGGEPRFIVAVDIDDVTDALVTANADVFVILVATLDDLLTAAAVTNLQTKLESVHIPADWINTSLSMRNVVGTVLRMFQLWQALNGQGVGGTVFAGGINLDSTFSSLPASTRTKLQAAAVALNLDISWVSGSTLIRAILKGAADRLYPAPLFLLGQSF